MPRFLSAVFLLAFVFPAPAFSQDDPSAISPSPEYPQVKMPVPRKGHAYRPRADYEPRPGDEATLYCEAGYSPLTKDASDLIALIALASRKESRSIEKMTRDSAAAFAGNGTRVKVLLRAKYSYRGEEFFACRVLFLDGPFTTQTAYTLSDFVVRLEEVELSPIEQVVQEQRERDAEKARKSLEHRSETLLKSGRNLERAGKVAGAIQTYREVLKAAPNSGSAREAAKRIAALKAAH
jgi:hypothetical protein